MIFIRTQIVLQTLLLISFFCADFSKSLAQSSTSLSTRDLGIDAIQSESPTSEAISCVRIFAEPLIPVGKTTPSDNIGISQVMQSFVKTNNLEDLQVFEDYAKNNPRSAWTPSLLVNLGTSFYWQGYYTKALECFQKGWDLSRNDESQLGKRVADLAGAQCVKMLSRVGRMKELENFLTKDLVGREMVGTPAEMVAQAKDSLWAMHNRPEKSFKCGPLALDSVARAMKLPNYSPKEVMDAASPTSGFAMSELIPLSEKIGLSLQPAKHTPGAEFPVPCVVHWKIGHYAAIIERIDNDYIVADPTFGEGMNRRITQAVLDEETSGYALVPIGKLSQGWKVAPSTETAAVFGKGTTFTNNPDETRPCSSKSGGPGCGCKGMATYAFHSMLTSLTISDNPLSYHVPYGPSISFTVTYNQKENGSPTTSTGSNFGPRWNFDWISWIDENSSSLSDVKQGIPGGGALPFILDSANLGKSKPQRDTQDISNRLGLGNYEVLHSDGSKDVFDSPTSLTYPRRVYLTKKYDVYGNFVSIQYKADNSQRIDKIVDATGKGSQFFYDLPADSTKVTKITDPFGRSALFRYDSQNRLYQIEDTVGIVSEFTYDSATADKVTQLKTPYGVTNFSYGESSGFSGSSRFRWIKATDPLGGSERMEFNETTSAADTVSGGNSVDSAKIPNIYARNNILYGRNSFFWDKRAFSQTPNLVANSSLITADYANAHVYHWIHSSDYQAADSHLESELNAGESRIWYNYPGQGFDAFTVLPSFQYQENITIPGTIASPSIIARMVPNPDGTATLVSQIDRYAYNSLGQTIRHQDPLGREERMIYDTNGIDLLKAQQLIAKTASTNLDAWTWETTSQATWNPQHLPLTRTDAAGQVTTYTYNPAGQISTVKNARNEITSYFYSPTGQPITGTPDPNAIGFLVQINGPLSGDQDITSMTYDGPGRLVARTEESGTPYAYTVSYEYDNLDRPTKTTYPDGYEQQIYNILDVEWMRDRNGHWTRTMHDALRRPTQQYDALGRVTENVWCECGSLEKIIDPNLNATTFMYDLRGRQTMRIFPKATPGSTTQDTYQTEYDSVGRKMKFTDAKGQVMRYRYNLDNTLKTLLHESAAIATADTVYEYDPLYPRVKSVEDKLSGTSVSKVSLTYYPPGQLGALQVNTTTSTFPAETITQTYDDLGRKATCTAAGATETSTYDTGGRLDTITNPLGTFTQAFVGGSRRLETVTRPGGLQMKYTYLPVAQNLRLESIENKRVTDGSRFSRYLYGYDPVGNITSWSQEQPTAATGPLTTSVWQNAYTAADEIARNTITTPQGGLAPEYNFAYDAAGNRKSEQSGSNLKSWTPNALNQNASEQGGGSIRVAGQINEPSTVTVNAQPVRLDAQNKFDTLLNVIVGVNHIDIVATDVNGNSTPVKRWDVTVPTAPTKSSSYDANGNLTTLTVASDPSQNRAYTWDARDRMLSVAIGTGAGLKTYRFSYDALGRRVKITEENSSSTVTSDKRYVWCGQRICLEKSATNSVTQRYYSQGFVDANTSTNYYYTRDHLGSVREVLNASNVLQTAFNYEAFGKQNRLFGTLNIDFGYTGHFTHAGSGLVLTLYRFYDPSFGKWLSRDPIWEKGGTNLYAYVANSPLVQTDLLGLEGTWTFTVSATSFSDSGAPLVDVYYTMSDDEKKCCKKAKVSREIAVPVGPGIGAWTPDDHPEDNMGGYTAPDGSAHAEGDAPDGPGPYRLPHTFLFRFKAVCEKGESSGKVLSTKEKRYHTDGHWNGSNGSGRWLN